MKHRVIKSVAVALSLSLLGSGCTFFGSEAEREEQLENLEDCDQGVTESERLDTILITEHYGESLHEMIACGNLTVLFCTSIMAAIVESLQSGANGTVPQGWAYEDGVYHTENTGVTMDLELFVSEDLQYGPSGTRIDENVFLVENFLVGASASLQSDGSVTIDYEATGPLIELLGFGAQPPNPLTISLSDLNTVGNALGDIAFDSVIVVDDSQRESVVHYEVTSERMTARDVVNTGSIPYSFVEATASRDSLNQSLTVNEWTIEFVDHGSLDGYSDFTVTGNHFQYEGRLFFENSPLPQRELRCP